MINNLLPKIDTLKADIAEIDKMKTLDDAMAISKTVTDSWMRFTAIFQNIKIAIGTQILAKLEPVMNRIADMGQEFTNWLRAYKNIARWIGYAVGALIGFTGLTAALTLMSGIVSAIGVAFSFLVSPVMLVVGAVIGLGIVIYKFHSQFMAFIAGFIDGFKWLGYLSRRCFLPLRLYGVHCNASAQLLGKLLAYSVVHPIRHIVSNNSA